MNRFALAIVVGRRLLWLIAGVLLLRAAAKGVVPSAGTIALGGRMFFGMLGVIMIVYAARSAARAVLEER